MMQGIGRYEIQARIGEGATADVFRAYDPTLDRVLAIKVLKPEFSCNPEYATRFLREARAAGALAHPNIVTVFDVGQANDAPYIAMELLDGEPLDKAMARGRMPVADVVRLALQLAEALGYAHALGVVHRDIKPSNIHLSGDGRTLKILDFGIARLTDGDVGEELLRTQVGQLVGTPRYMSPEQALSRQIDGRSDLFSTGVVLYELLSGAKAFDGVTAVALALQITQVDPRPLRELSPDVPRGLQFIVHKLLAKRPERRFASGGQLAQALRREMQVLAAVQAEGGARRRGLPLPVRATLLMAALTGVALFASIGGMLHRQDAALLQMSATSGAAIANFVASNAALSAAENAALPPEERDWLPVQAFVKAASADPNIQEIVVVDAEGVVRAASRTGRVGSRYALAAHPRPALTSGAARNEAMQFVRPITYAGREFGKVDVQISQGARLAASAVSRTLLAALAAVVLGVVVAGSYLMARNLADPVRRLRRAIGDISDGDLDFRISHDRRDEFGELFNAFNRMCAIMQDRLEAAEMERRDRTPVAAGPPTLALAAEGDPDRTQIGAFDPEKTLMAARV